MRFVEHGLASDPGVANWQDRLTLLRGRLPPRQEHGDLVRGGGFRLAALSTGYARGRRAMIYM
jgi:hypothetical protein